MRHLITSKTSLAIAAAAFAITGFTISAGNAATMRVANSAQALAFGQPLAGTTAKPSQTVLDGAAGYVPLTTKPAYRIGRIVKGGIASGPTPDG
jgi:hypothetical protein